MSMGVWHRRPDPRERERQKEAFLAEKASEQEQKMEEKQESAEWPTTHRVDEHLYLALYAKVNGISEHEAGRVFFENHPDNLNDADMHASLRDLYVESMNRDSEGTLKFLEQYPQMETVHGEWRRMQQGFEPISPYNLEGELVVSQYLSRFDPDLSVSDMRTLFPEQIHELNRESFEDVCRRFGRDEFRRAGIYMTGNSTVDDAFMEFDEELMEEAQERMDRYMDELAEQLEKEEGELGFDDEEKYSKEDLEEVILF